MEDESSRHLIRKPAHNSKLFTGRLNRNRRGFPFASSPLFPSDERKVHLEKEPQKNIGLKINEQNISLIAKKEGSFMSRQDHSMDSFDKMIIGVDEEADVEDQDDTFNSKEQEPNYSFLYREFQRLIKVEKIKQDQSVDEEPSQILQQELLEPDIDKEDKRQEKTVGGPKRSQVLRDKLEEVLQMQKSRSQSQTQCNTSLRLLGSNLLEIQEEEIQHNTSVTRTDLIEEEFIEFVGKGQGSKANISQIERFIGQKLKQKGKARNELNSSLKQEDQVVAMLQNELGSRRQTQIQEEESIINDEMPSIKKDKKSYSKENYNQILRELDDNQEKRVDTSHQMSLVSNLSRRQQWINRSQKSIRWKQRQLSRLSKIREIMENPFVDFSDQEDEGSQE